MSNEILGSGIVHNVQVKFRQAYLPEAKKPFILKSAHQKDLTISELVRKAIDYNIGISPQQLEQCLIAGFKLIAQLTADGFRIVTPLFTVKIKVQGEYDGTETSLPDGVFPTVFLQTTAQFQKYIKDTVEIEFDGKLETDGFIASAFDEATGLTDESATRGNFLTLRGIGLKILADEGDKDQAGLFFVPESGAPIKAELIATNQPRTLKVIVPQTLEAGKSYRLSVQTQCSARANGHLLKKMREMQSEFMVIAQ